MDLAVIGKQTRLGKPLGDRGFLEMLPKKLGYKLNFISKGRPKKGCVPKYPYISRSAITNFNLAERIQKNSIFSNFCFNIA